MGSGAGRTKVRRRTLAAQLDTTGACVSRNQCPDCFVDVSRIFRMRINVLGGLPE